jgi:hypothetical protein
LQARLFAVFVGPLLVGCTHSVAEKDPLPDPTVYDASPETRADVGIATWGAFVDSATSSSIFHGYGPENELLVEIRQTFEQADDFRKRFTMTMTGAASGSERIEFVANVGDDDQAEATYTQNVLENTLVAGSVGARILAHLAPDARAISASSHVGGEFSGALLPRVALTTRSPDLLQCCGGLVRDAEQMAAMAASACPLASPGKLLRSSSAGATGPTEVHPAALVIGADGTPTVQSPWTGPYNIVDYQCHDAAQANVSTTDGYIGCSLSAWTTSYSGHTVNWAPDPSRAGTPDAFCAYDPMFNGESLGGGIAVCCWQGDTASSGAPLLTSPAAEACMKKLCPGQYEPGAARAFPPVDTPPVPMQCPFQTTEYAQCTTCCTSQAQQATSVWSGSKDWAAELKDQVADYRKRCSVGCTDAELRRQARNLATSNANGCLAAGLNARTSSSSAGKMCSPSSSPQ